MTENILKWILWFMLGATTLGIAIGYVARSGLLNMITPFGVLATAFAAISALGLWAMYQSYTAQKPSANTQATDKDKQATSTPQADPYTPSRDGSADEDKMPPQSDQPQRSPRLSK